MDWHKEISKILFYFGDTALRAPPDYYEAGKRLGHNVFLKLQKSAKKFTVAEPHFNGSFGKKTDVVQPDLDLVITMNNFQLSRMDLPEVLEEIRVILTKHSGELKIVKNRIKCSSRLVQFCFTNGIEVDLLPSPNLTEQQVYELMAQNPSNHMNYSVCLGEKQKAFIQSHPGNFVHALIRLLKLWNKSLVGLGKLYGGSSLMEVVAVAVTELEENNSHGNPDMWCAVTTAMEWFINLDRIKIVFEEVGTHQWKLIDSSKLTSLHAGQLVPKVVGTKDILEQSSFVIDPANPYNDLLPLNPDQRMKLIAYARESKFRFQALLERKEKFIQFNCRTKLWDVDILNLFRAQPDYNDETFPISVPDNVSIQFHVRVTIKTNSMKIRNAEAYRLESVQNYIARIKRDLLCAIHTGLHGKNGNRTDKTKRRDIRKNVLKLMKGNVKTSFVHGRSHKNMDVCLLIPYEWDRQQYAVMVSFSW